MSSLRLTRIARRQAGSALIISTILLVVLTLTVLSAIKSTTVNSKVAGNLQIKNEAEAAAQQAIEAVITSNFQDAPVASSVAVNVSNAATSSSVGKFTVTVAKPSCRVVVPVKTLDLDVVNTPDDVACLMSSSDPRPGATNGDSACFTRHWDIQATATPTSSGNSKAVIHQGVSERVSPGAACSL